jgi:hypothetical protein
MNYFAVSVAIVAFTMGGAAQETKPATAPSLDGTWIVTSINGEEAPAGSPEVTLTIKGDKYHQALGSQRARHDQGGRLEEADDDRPRHK